MAKDDPQSEVKKLRYQAELDIYKADYEAGIALEKAQTDAAIEAGKLQPTADIDREKTAVTNINAQDQLILAAYLDVAKGSLDRAAGKATFVQAAATAMSGIYAGVLSLRYAVDKGSILPLRGIAPAFFLGLAVVLATVYLSFLTTTGTSTAPAATGNPELDILQERNSFLKWIGGATLHRHGFLQGSVLSLGIGALLLPLPFLTISDVALCWIAGGGLAVVVVLPLLLKGYGK
jgi:hypothetical protein